MQTNIIHATQWDCIGRDLAKLWCRIPPIWSVPARRSLCECLSLAIYQSGSYCLSLEQDRAQVLGWQGWDSLCTQQKVLNWVESRLPPLPAWPENWGTIICLTILFRVLGGYHGASFWRLMGPVSILSPSTLYLMQQKVEHKVSPCLTCLWSRWVQFSIAFPATGGFYSTAMLLFKKI